jgi:hypothetical protein
MFCPALDEVPEVLILPSDLEQTYMGFGDLFRLNQLISYLSSSNTTKQYKMTIRLERFQSKILKTVEFKQIVVWALSDT